MNERLIRHLGWALSRPTHPRTSELPILRRPDVLLGDLTLAAHYFHQHKDIAQWQQVQSSGSTTPRASVSSNRTTAVKICLLTTLKFRAGASGLFRKTKR